MGPAPTHPPAVACFSLHPGQPSPALLVERRVCTGQLRAPFFQRLSLPSGLQLALSQCLSHLSSPLRGDRLEGEAGDPSSLVPGAQPAESAVDGRPWEAGRLGLSPGAGGRRLSPARVSL